MFYIYIPHFTIFITHFKYLFSKLNSQKVRDIVSPVQQEAASVENKYLTESSLEDSRLTPDLNF